MAIAALIPLSASQARDAHDDPGDLTPSPASSTGTALAATGFARQFEPYAGPPRPVELKAGAVDLSTFDPPIEQPPELSANVVRSLGTGIASYYGRRFHGRRTANGERFDMRAMTAAHRTLPFGTRVRVTNPRNGRSVVVRVNDRGPFIRGRSIDLSRAAAEKIGMISRGHARVKLEIVR
ncbi:MAG: septal ring lytic transglycosylase RlpA family protein [Erythrobacter sp.]|nr:septal ring lytic transglycosylase RlpA family protein [Erythrobacter sp.]